MGDAKRRKQVKASSATGCLEVSEEIYSLYVYTVLSPNPITEIHCPVSSLEEAKGLMAELLIWLTEAKDNIYDNAIVARIFGEEGFRLLDAFRKSIDVCYFGKLHLPSGEKLALALADFNGSLLVAKITA